MIDEPGPWGTGPFTLVQGVSSISTRIAVMSADPFSCAWLIEAEDRSPQVVLEANRNHWNTERGPRLERVVFRNDLTPDEALERCLTTDGEVDIVTEVSPADAQRVLDSEHARLVVGDANRVLVGIVNRYARDVPLDRVEVRRALNLAVDTRRVIDEGLNGYANELRSMTTSWSSGFDEGMQPYGHDPAAARELFEGAGWPEGRPLVVAAPESFAGIARMLADDYAAALGIATTVAVIPAQDMLAASRLLVEKKIPPDFDVLVHGWFDLSSDAPPAAVHREFFGRDGAFRAGPVHEGFDALFAEMASSLDGDRLVEVAGRIDALVHDEALAVFLAAPQALYAVNRHVEFAPYATTFELAECTVTPEHWSLRGGGTDGGGETRLGGSGAAGGGVAGHGTAAPGDAAPGDAAGAERARAKPGFSGASGNAC